MLNACVVTKSLAGEVQLKVPREEKVTRALLPHLMLSVLCPRPLTRAVQH